MNLGTNDELKPTKGSVSLWVNIGIAIESGEGYKMNPIIITKCQNTDDFFEAYCIYYDYARNKFAGGTTLSQLNQVGISSNLSPDLNRWYHIVITYDDNWFALYVDGKQNNKLRKGFISKFLAGDSVMVGNSANTKNKRFFSGSIDDIMIYNRVLSANEVQELYNAPNPNKNTVLIKWIIFFLLGILLIVGIIVFFVRRYKKAFEKEMEKNRLQNQIYELEIKAMKAQMNPHFIFNSLNSIQQFILANDNDNAYKYLSKFSKLVRKLLESTASESIKLEEEIDILKRYIEIESLRFEETFSHEIIVDKQLNISSIQIPHMLIQPFVENAIWHGLLHKTDNRQLIVKFSYLDNAKMLCIIDDNGVGRGSQNPDNEIMGKKSLAITFIKERLNLLAKIHKTDCGIKIIDKKDNAGTIVEVTIPILTK